MCSGAREASPAPARPSAQRRGSSRWRGPRGSRPSPFRRELGSWREKGIIRTWTFQTCCAWVIHIILTAEWNKVVSRRADEERRISPIAARMKKVVSRRADEERRISALLRPVSTWPVYGEYDVLRPHAEIRPYGAQPSICRSTAILLKLLIRLKFISLNDIKEYCKVCIWFSFTNNF